MSKPADILRSTPLARDYAKSFASATGLPIAIEPPGEFHPDNTALPDCCRDLLMRDKACEKCADTHLGLQGPESRTVRCFMGLTSSAIPVVVRNETVAYLHTGHAAVNGDAGTRNSGAPRMSRGQYEGALRLLELFAQQLAGNLPEAPQGAPYPAIDRTAREIRRNPEKPWRLGTVASAAKMNSAYFSEMFRKRFGLTFTTFLAGARVEKAKQLLQNTEMKIIEVAYASGFGSVSQFNRIFARLAGTSPRLYRGRR